MKYVYDLEGEINKGVKRGEGDFGGEVNTAQNRVVQLLRVQDLPSKGY
jgi:hypothetical protein